MHVFDNAARTVDSLPGRAKQRAQVPMECDWVVFFGALCVRTDSAQISRSSCSGLGLLRTLEHPILGTRAVGLRHEQDCASSAVVFMARYAQLQLREDIS